MEPSDHRVTCSLDSMCRVPKQVMLTYPLPHLPHSGALYETACPMLVDVGKMCAGPDGMNPVFLPSYVSPKCIE